MKIRKGFTLMEMLVVIVTLGILSAVMMFSSLEAVSSVDANNIINNMQQIKMATYAWYKENLSRIIPDKSQGYKIRTKGVDQLCKEFIRDHQSEILQYLDTNTSLVLRAKNDSKGSNNIGEYALIALKNNKYWYVCYTLGKTSDIIDKYGSEAQELMIKRKIAGRAKTLNLSGKSSIDDDNMEETIYNDQIFVCMPILQLP